MARLVYFIFFVITISLYFSDAPIMDRSIMLFLLGFVLFSLIIFVTKKENNKNLQGQLLKHSYLFLIGYLIVSFQFYIDFIIYNIDENYQEIWVNRSIVVKSMAIVTAGLLTFLIGYSTTKFDKTSFIKNKSVKKIINTKFIFIIWVLSLIVFYSTVSPLYLLGYYGKEGAEIGRIPSLAIFLFHSTFYVLLIQKLRNLKIHNNYNLNLNVKEYLQKLGLSFISIVFIYLVTILFSGDRGPLMTVGLSMFAGYVYLNKRKLKFLRIIPFFILGVFFISLLGKARSLDRDISLFDRISLVFNDDIKVVEQESFLEPTKELAKSLLTTHTAINYIDYSGNYTYGRFQFQQIANSIPFFSIFYPLIFTDNHKKFSSSASYITWIIQGDHPFFGNGTSSTADLYLDFGFLGVLLGMLIFGFFIRYLEVIFYAEELTSLPFQVLSFVYLTNAFYLGRSSLLFNIKICSVIYIILLLNTLISKGINKKKYV